MWLRLLSHYTGYLFVTTSMRYVTLHTKKHFILSVNVFSTKVLIWDTIFTSPCWDGTAILRGYPSHAKVYPFAGQMKYLHFSVILRPWVLVRPQESKPRPSTLQSSALSTELILPLKRPARRGFAPLQKSHRIHITVFMHEQKSGLIRFSCLRKSYPV